MARAAAVAVLAALAFAAWAPGARAADFRVVIVPRLQLEDVSGRGAIGLLVPGAGPTVSQASARAALARGKVENSLRDRLPSGPVQISVRTSDRVPAPPVIVLALPGKGSRDNDRRYPIAVLGRGYRGLLTSDTTRAPGLVSIADVAPTALGRKGALGWQIAADPVARLAALERRIRDHDDTWVPAMLLAAALIALLVLAAPRAAVLAFGTLLAANLVLGATGTATRWAALLSLALAGIAAVPLAAALDGWFPGRRKDALGLALAAVLVSYLVAFAIDGAWVAGSPFGPAPNGRFYGLSNLPETLLLVPALAAAAYLRRPLAFAAVAAVAFVTVAGSRFGADGGGAVVLAVGYSVLAVLLAGARRRALAVALPAAAALVVAFVAADAATGASSHVTRALADGPGGLASDLADRLVVSWRRATDPWALAVAIGAAIAGLVAVVAETARRRQPGRELVYAFAAAIATSLVVNDSPLEVSLFGFLGCLALARAGHTGETWSPPFFTRA